MADQPKSRVGYDHVTFTPDSGGGGMVFIELDGQWTRSVGIKPSVNKARISYKEFAKLGSNLDVTGSIQFWYNAAGGSNNAAGGAASADVTLMGERLIAVDSSELGEIPSGDVITVEYVLFFSDFREQFVAPRGGRLQLGVLNAGVKPVQQSLGAGGDPPPPTAPEKKLSELITVCLQKMGIDANLPGTVDDSDAPRDVRWFGNHAPTELAKLLDLAGLAFVPGFNGKATIAPITTQGDPTLPASDQLTTQKIPQIDRRGKSVVFSSFPQRTINTTTADGPSPDTWSFVVQTSTNAWAAIETADVLKGYGNEPAAAIRDGFKGTKEIYRDRLIRQTYRCIQCVQKPPSAVSPILPARTEADMLEYPIQVLAQIAIKQDDGTWANSKDPVEIAVRHLHEPDVLELDLPLVQVLHPTTNPAADFKGVAPFKVRYTVESATDNGDDTWTPDFLHMGFSGGAGGAQPLSDGDAENAIDGNARDCIILCRPQWRLVNVDGQEVNKADLQAKAQTEAKLYLQDASQPARRYSRRGFASVECSGLVTEVKWDQKSLRTDIRVADWYQPNGALGDNHQLREMEGGGGEAYPQQAAMESSGTAAGESGSNLPTVPVQPLRVISGGDKQLMRAGHLTGSFPKLVGFYSGLELSGQATDVAAQLNDPSDFLDMPEGMIEQTPDQANVYFFPEEDGLKVGGRLDTSNHWPLAFKVGFIPNKNGQGGKDILMLPSIKGSRKNPKNPGFNPDDNSGIGTSIPSTLGWSWDDDGKPLDIVVPTRIFWDGTLNRWLQFQRTWSFDALGKLYNVTTESYVVITDTTNC